MSSLIEIQSMHHAIGRDLDTQARMLIPGLGCGMLAKKTVLDWPEYDSRIARKRDQRHAFYMSEH